MWPLCSKTTNSLLGTPAAIAWAAWTEHVRSSRPVSTSNGCGIAHEHLGRIFENGFTTKAGGQGIGLHSASLAARELGGALFVHSEGAGKGARFTLELPVRPPEAISLTDMAAADSGRTRSSG